MKKLLAILSMTGFVASSGATVIACSGGDEWSTNPSNLDELETFLTDNKGIIKEYVEYYKKIESSELMEFISKPVSDLTDDEKSTLLKSEEFQKYNVLAIKITSISYKVLQYLNSATANEQEEFWDKNREILTEYQISSDSLESLSTESKHVDLVNKQIEELEYEKIMTSTTIDSIKSIAKWIDDNKFKSSK